MPRISILVFLLTVVGAFPAFASPPSALVGEQIYVEADTTDSVWDRVVGRKAQDGLLMGMWSLHLDGSGDMTGGGHHNEHNILKGFQYSGLSLCFFFNSNDASTVYGGFAREIIRHDFSRKFSFDFNYKIGLMHGYGDKFPNIGGVSLFFTPFASFSYQRAGIDFGLVPMGVLTANFRIGL